MPAVRFATTSWGALRKTATDCTHHEPTWHKLWSPKHQQAKVASTTSSSHFQSFCSFSRCCPGFPRSVSVCSRSASQSSIGRMLRQPQTRLAVQSFHKSSHRKWGSLQAACRPREHADQTIQSLIKSHGHEGHDARQVTSPKGRHREQNPQTQGGPWKHVTCHPGSSRAVTSVAETFVGVEVQEADLERVAGVRTRCRPLLVGPGDDMTQNEMKVRA